MDPVIAAALIAAALNIGFLAGRVFERWEWVARRERIRREDVRRGQGSGSGEDLG